MTTTQDQSLEGLGNYKFGWSDSDVAGASARRGLNEDVVRDISAKKSEPEWMLAMRLKEQLLRAYVQLTGNRLLRGLACLGGVRFDFDADLFLLGREQLRHRANHQRRWRRADALERI